MSDSSKPATAAHDTIGLTQAVGNIPARSCVVALPFSNRHEADQVWQWLRLLLQRHGAVLIHALWIPPGLFALYFLWSFVQALLGWD